MLQGAFGHEDFMGNAGRIEAGDLQFMTAGKGIMHSEMPIASKDGTPTIGMQLWVDLPEKLKFCEPRYRDLKAAEIPTIDVDDGKTHIKIISGKSYGVDSVKELSYNPVWILDVEMKPGGKVTQQLPVGWNAFALTLNGTTSFGVGKDKTTVEQFHMVVFEQKGDEVIAQVDESAKENGRICKLFLHICRCLHPSLTLTPHSPYKRGSSETRTKKKPPSAAKKTKRIFLRSPGIEPGAHRCYKYWYFGNCLILVYAFLD